MQQLSCRIAVRREREIEREREGGREHDILEILAGIKFGGSVRDRHMYMYIIYE